jgi:hypothetical protein
MYKVEFMSGRGLYSVGTPVDGLNKRNAFT